MALNLTASDYNVVTQRTRRLYCKINLLDFNYQTVNSLEGRVIGGSLSVDADSDIRRTMSLQMVVEDASEEIKVGGEIWLDKFIQVFIGIIEIQTEEIHWMNQGIYLINSPQVDYDASNNTMSISCVDLMAKLTGLRNGSIPGMDFVVPQGSIVRDVVKSILTQFTTFNKYIIIDAEQEVPYDIQVEKDGTLYDILTQLRDINSNYEFFFDVNGVFHWQPIPNGYNEPVMVDDSIWDEVKISYTINVDFENVKNHIIVYGKSHTPTEYAGETTLNNNVYSGTIQSMTKPPSKNTTIGFLVNTPIKEPYLKINEYPAMRLENEDGSAAVLDATNDTVYYVARVIDETHALFLGHQQVVAEAQDNNPDSPYYIGNPAGKITKVCAGGDYENIYTDDLARQRAEYELYLYCRLNDSLSLTCVPLYWMDVNILIQISGKGIDGDGIYMVKNFSYDLTPDATMSITASKYYPQYPYPLSSNNINVRDVIIGDGSKDISVDTSQIINPGIQLDPPTAINETVEWVSGDESVVSVDNDGNIYGVSEGKTTVTVIVNGGASDTVNVSVNKSILETSMLSKQILDTNNFETICDVTYPVTILDLGSWRTFDIGRGIDGIVSNNDWYVFSSPFRLESNSRYKITFTVQNKVCDWSGEYYNQSDDDYTTNGGHLVLPDGNNLGRKNISSTFQKIGSYTYPQFLRFPFVFYVFPAEVIPDGNAYAMIYQYNMNSDNSIMFYYETPNQGDLSITFTTPNNIESEINDGKIVDTYMCAFRWTNGILDIDDPVNGPVKWSGDPNVKVKNLQIHKVD